MIGTFYEFLKSNYKPNCPIFAKEICFQEMSPSNIRYHLAQLEEKGYIEKAEPGIYYFPETDITGAKVRLSSDDIAYGKYIRQTGKCTGFYSGYTFANHIGLTTQVPYVKEICSNAAPAPVREVTIYEDNISIYHSFDLGKLPKYENYFPKTVIEHIKQNLDIRNLSGGEKQVVAILRALCSEKQILLMDEPFAAMNQMTIDVFMGHMKEIHKTILIIAHNIDDYSGVFDEEILIERK